MTIQATEASTQGAAPIELYKLSADRTGGLGTGAGGGGTVDVQTLEAWAYNGSDINDLLASWPYDAVHAGGSSNFGSAGNFSITTSYSGSLGGGQGHVYHYRTFSGFPVGEQGRISVPLTLSRDPSPFDAGVQVDDGSGFTTIDLAPGTPLSLTLTRDVTIPAGGDFTIRLGHFDLEFGEPSITLTWGPITYTRLGAAPGTADDGDAPAVYTYTSADVPVIYGGETYLPAVLERSALVSGGQETGQADVAVTLPRDHEVARLFHYGNAQLPVALDLIRLHRDNLTDNGDGTYTVTDETQVVTPLVGALATKPTFRENSCALTFAPAETLVDRRVPRYTCGRSCPWMLYDAHTCKVNRGDFALTGVAVDGVSGRVVAVPGIAAWSGSDPYKAKHGLLIPPTGAQRTIVDVDVSSETVTLLDTIPDLAVGDLVDILAGCDQTAATCQTRFSNIENFGGWEDMPVRTPWTGGGLA